MRLILSISMNIIKKPVILSILLSLLGLSHLGAMEQREDSLKSFDIATSYLGDFHFKKVDIETLSENELKIYIDQTSDFDAIQQMLGTFAACIFTPIQWCMTDSIYHSFGIDKKDNDPAKGNWFIEQKDQFVGSIGLTGLNVEVPQEILSKIRAPKENILCVEAIMGKDSRRKGIAKELIPHFITLLEDTPLFKGKAILIATSADNKPVHRLAGIGSFTSLGEATIPLELGLFTLNAQAYFFVKEL